MKTTHKIAAITAALLMSVAGASAFAAAHAAAAGSVMVGGAPMLPTKDIIDNAVNSKDHTTLVAAVKAAGLVETLKGPGPFTVFAPTNAAFAALQLEIDRHDPALVVLAGFMRILTPGFVQHFAGRLINIHPSLLPAFSGLNTHQRALDAGCTVAGATVHQVTTELDHGPILAQAVVPVLPGDTAAQLAARVQAQEHVLYPKAVLAFFRALT